MPDCKVSVDVYVNQRIKPRTDVYNPDYTYYILWSLCTVKIQMWENVAGLTVLYQNNSVKKSLALTFFS